MTAIDVIARVRAAGADITIAPSGPRIRNGSRVPVSIVALCRAHREDIIAELTRPDPAQLVLDLGAAPPLSFLDQQDALFTALCAEFRIAIAPPAGEAEIGKACEAA